MHVDKHVSNGQIFSKAVQGRSTAMAGCPQSLFKQLSQVALAVNRLSHRSDSVELPSLRCNG